MWHNPARAGFPLVQDAEISMYSRDRILISTFACSVPNLTTETSALSMPFHTNQGGWFAELITLVSLRHMARFDTIYGCVQFIINKGCACACSCMCLSHCQLVLPINWVYIYPQLHELHSVVHVLLSWNKNIPNSVIFIDIQIEPKVTSLHDLHVFCVRSVQSGSQQRFFYFTLCPSYLLKPSSSHLSVMLVLSRYT